MTELIGYVIRGIPFGCVFGLLAIGLVLTYKTSGVFNLAFAAQAFASAAVFYELKANDGWSTIPAFVVAVVVVAPLIGFVLDRFLFRHLRTAPTVAKLVVSLGLLVAIPEIVDALVRQSDPAYGPPTIWPERVRDLPLRELRHRRQPGGHASSPRPCRSLALTLLFRYSTIGLRMRAVVESPRMTALAGINADRVSRLRVDALEPVRRSGGRPARAAL